MPEIVSIAAPLSVSVDFPRSRAIRLLVYRGLAHVGVPQTAYIAKWWARWSCHGLSRRLRRHFRTRSWRTFSETYSHLSIYFQAEPPIRERKDKVAPFGNESRLGRRPVDSSISMPTFNGLRRNHRLATNDPVPEEQAPLPQSALASLRRGGRSRSTHWASLAGYSVGQFFNPGEEQLENRRGV